MKAVQLFDVESAAALKPTAADIVTPLGTIELSLAGGAIRVAGIAPATLRVSTHARVHVWDHPDFRAELLVATINPEVPPSLVVAGCQVGLWRVRAVTEIDRCVFDAVWRAGSTPAEGGPSSGQGLAALTWSVGRLEVSLGAWDAEAMAWNARAGFSLPTAWRAVIDVDDPSNVIIEEYLNDGLRLRLPGLCPGELGQVHFAAAWADTAAQSSAAWFAVDLSAGQILTVLEAAV